MKLTLLLDYLFESHRQSPSYRLSFSLLLLPNHRLSFLSLKTKEAFQANTPPPFEKVWRFAGLLSQKGQNLFDGSTVFKAMCIFVCSAGEG